MPATDYGPFSITLLISYLKNLSITNLTFLKYIFNRFSLNIKYKLKNFQIKFTDISYKRVIIKIRRRQRKMGIIIITLILVAIMYGMTFLSYLSESHILDDVIIDNQ